MKAADIVLVILFAALAVSGVRHRNWIAAAGALAVVAAAALDLAGIGGPRL